MDAFPVKWARGLRLRERVALQLGTAAALVAIVVATALYLHGQYAQNSLQTASLSTTRQALLQLPVNRLILTGKRLARSLAKPEIWDNGSLMSVRLSAARDATSLIDIRVFAPDGSPLFVGSRPAEADDPPHPEGRQPGSIPRAWATRQIGKRIHVTGPIEYRGQSRGTLVFAKSTLPVEQEIELLEDQLSALAIVRQAESQQIAWVIGSSLVALALLTGVVLARRLSAPILDLQSMTARIAGGDFHSEQKVHRADELGDLAQSIEQMAAQLDSTTVSRQFFSQVIEGMLDGLIVATRSGKISMANGAAGRMIGSPAQDLIGTPIQSYIGREKAGNPIQLGSTIYTLSCTGGRKIPVLVTASKVRLHQDENTAPKIRLPQDENKATVFVFRDISDLIARQEQLRIALANAEAASRAKTEFLANMSHELRTPLNAIIGFSDILSGDSGGTLAQDKRAEFASDINASGNHLLQIINDVLDLSKIEHGDMTIQADQVNAGRLARAMESLTRPKASESGLEFELQLNVDGQMTFEADESKLKKALNNLLSNAVKFTPSPGVVILNVDQKADDLVFTIRDTGIGMTAEELAMAFQPFRQADNSHTRKYDGTGLGLTLARRLTELHGGRLEMASQKNHGTTVSVRIPLRTLAADGMAA